MKKKIRFIVGAVLIVLIVGGYYILSQKRPPIETKFVQPTAQRAIRPGGEEGAEPSISIKKPGDSALLGNPKHVYQTFNNCGPATLSMIFSWLGKNVSQGELGDKMRPYQNSEGDNDDKTIFTYEFVNWANEYGFEGVSRVNGDIELLKTFTANGIPVVVKTWLHVGEDIGHFRIVRGFDDSKKVIIQDDSYEGPNKKISYFDFLSMWQPFNYAYIIVYSSSQKDLVEAIIGEEMDENISWQNALFRAEKEAELDPENVYPWFNISTAQYHLGNLQSSVEAFEKVENLLPRRMLWYQIEPIQAYQDLKDYDRVFQIVEKILNGGNRAFSEIYLIRGEIYLSQGNSARAKEEFEKAILYNENSKDAKKSLNSF